MNRFPFLGRTHFTLRARYLAKLETFLIFQPHRGVSQLKNHDPDR